MCPPRFVPPGRRGRRSGRALICCAGLALFVAGSSASAQAGSERKIGPSLRALIARFETGGITRESFPGMDVPELAGPGLRLDGAGRVQVYVHLAESGEAELATLAAMEFETEVVNARLAIVQGLAPVDRLRDIAALGFVTRIVPPRYGLTRNGAGGTE